MVCLIISWYIALGIFLELRRDRINKWSLLVQALNGWFFEQELSKINFPSYQNFNDFSKVKKISFLIERLLISLALFWSTNFVQPIFRQPILVVCPKRTAVSWLNSFFHRIFLSVNATTGWNRPTKMLQTQTFVPV